MEPLDQGMRDLHQDLELQDMHLHLHLLATTAKLDQVLMVLRCSSLVLELHHRIWGLRLFTCQ